MPFIYRITRREPPNRQPAKAGVSVSAKSYTGTFDGKSIVTIDEVVEPSYRDLQAQAKTLGIPGNQTADDLKKAIEDAT